MSVAADHLSDQLVSEIAELRLFPEHKLRSLRRKLDRARSDHDVNRAINSLVGRKGLTVFQASELLKGRGSNLVYGDYTVVDEVGAGGMGQVFKAIHQTSSKTVALKVMNRSSIDSKVALDRFQREIKVTQKLSHPSIITALDTGEINGVPFLVTPFVDGTDLQMLVEKSGPLSFSLARKYLLQAAQGLQHAHTQGLIHRDIKPSNLMIDAKHRLTILDLGLARFDPVVDQFDSNTQTRLELTRAGIVIGTVDYVAPEQAQDARKADARSDIYSLGCTVHFMLTGRPIYDDERVIDKLVAHRTSAIPSLRDERQDVPKWFDRVFRRMVAKEAADRFASMAQIIAELQPGLLSITNIVIGASLVSAVAMGSILLNQDSDTDVARNAVSAHEEKLKVVDEEKGKRPNKPAAFRSTRSVALSSPQEFANWIIDMEGSFESVDDGGRISTVDTTTALPLGKLQIRGVNLSGKLIANRQQITQLGQLKELEHLFLNDSDFGDQQLILVTKLVKLRLLFLNNTRVSDVGIRQISHLKELRYLDLIGTRISDAGLEQLKSLSKLEVLRVQQTSVTPSGVQALQKALPKCRIVQ